MSIDLIFYRESPDSTTTPSEMNYHYIHIHAAELFWSSTDDVALTMDSFFPKDSLFCAAGFWCFHEFKEKIAANKHLKITFEAYELVLGANLIESGTIVQIPKTVYRITFHGIPSQDDFGAFKDKFLVVSDAGLKILRANGVIKSEADKITGPVEDYFSQLKHYFWMPESLRKKWIENFHKV